LLMNDDRYDDDYDDEPSHRRLAPHRGTLILVLGIMGLAVCALCGVAAWIMGGHDLKEIKAGRMDPAGKDQTQIGYILGIVSTAILAITLLMLCVLFGLMGMRGAAN
jgi:hypothetical protein